MYLWTSQQSVSQSLLKASLTQQERRTLLYIIPLMDLAAQEMVGAEMMNVIAKEIIM